MKINRIDIVRLNTNNNQNKSNNYKLQKENNFDKILKEALKNKKR